jgi:transcriptional antiterminator RfaH
MSEWYLVYCKARQEDVAAQGLKEQGYGVYLPKLPVKKRRRGGIAEVEEPLFPRYTTFLADQAEGI